MQIVEAKFTRNGYASHAAAQPAAPAPAAGPPAPAPAARAHATAAVHLNAVAMLRELQQASATHPPGSSTFQTSGGAEDTSSMSHSNLPVARCLRTTSASALDPKTSPKASQQQSEPPNMSEEMRNQLHEFGSLFLDRLSDSATSAGLQGPGEVPAGASTDDTCPFRELQPSTGT